MNGTLTRHLFQYFSQREAVLSAEWLWPSSEGLSPSSDPADKCLDTGHTLKGGRQALLLVLLLLLLVLLLLLPLLLPLVLLLLLPVPVQVHAEASVEMKAGSPVVTTVRSSSLPQSPPGTDLTGAGHSSSAAPV